MGLLIEVLARHNALGLVAFSGQSYIMQHAYSQHGFICLHQSVIPITIHAFVLKAPLDISILLLLPLGCLLGSPLVLLRGGGVTAAPAAKLPVARNNKCLKMCAILSHANKAVNKPQY